MIQIENQIISLDIFEKHFFCDLKSCKGACCVEGDSGAPLEDYELQKLKEIYNKIKPYMQKAGIKKVKKSGLAVYDEEGDLTTSLINNKECVFVTEENGISFCAIEKAYLEGKTDFKKPISCHLFPIRITQYEELILQFQQVIKFIVMAESEFRKFSWRNTELGQKLSKFLFLPVSYISCSIMTREN